jgi:Ras-related protein Rab-18
LPLLLPSVAAAAVCCCFLFQHDRREVTWQEGADFAKQHGCLFVETSAKHNIAVGVAFEELVLRILDTPALLAAVAAEEQKGSSVNLMAAQPPASGMAISCSC